MTEKKTVDANYLVFSTSIKTLRRLINTSRNITFHEERLILCSHEYFVVDQVRCKDAAVVGGQLAAHDPGREVPEGRGRAAPAHHPVPSCTHAGDKGPQRGSAQLSFCVREKRIYFGIWLPKHKTNLKIWLAHLFPWTVEFYMRQIMSFVHYLNYIG